MRIIVKSRFALSGQGTPLLPGSLAHISLLSASLNAPLVPGGMVAAVGAAALTGACDISLHFYIYLFPSVLLHDGIVGGGCLLYLLLLPA